jgi:hypothetical protein
MKNFKGMHKRKVFMNDYLKGQMAKVVSNEELW